jgi:hypothetical protein
MIGSSKPSTIYCVAIPFFGGFLGALGVAGVKYLLAVIGFTTQINVSLQWFQNFSWGGAIWGFIPAIFLLVRRGNVYLVSLLTMFIAVSYDLFVLQGLPLIHFSKIILEYLIGLVYFLILALTIIKACAIVEHKFIFRNLLPKPIDIINPPKQFFKCPNCKKQFEKLQDLKKHASTHR